MDANLLSDFVSVPAMAGRLDRRWSLIILPGSARHLMLDLAARLAQKGTLRILDGGNGFNVYTVSRALSRRSADLRAVLQRISVARAFTCYQVLSLLQQTPASPHPLLALDLLSTFSDQNVPFLERRRLLAKGIIELERLGSQAPLVVSARLCPEGQAEPEALLQELEAAAAQVLRIELDAPRPPLRLF